MGLQFRVVVDVHRFAMYLDNVYTEAVLNNDGEMDDVYERFDMSGDRPSRLSLASVGNTLKFINETIRDGDIVHIRITERSFTAAIKDEKLIITREFKNECSNPQHSEALDVDIEDIMEWLNEWRQKVDEEAYLQTVVKNRV